LRIRTFVFRKILFGKCYKITSELVLFEEMVPVLGKSIYLLALDCQYHSDTRTAVPPAAVNLSACSNICSQLPQSDSQYLRYQQYCDCLLSQLLRYCNL